VYFDTSALIKLIVAEDGSELAAELWADHRAACNVLGYAEARAALAAATRAKRLTGQAHRRAVAALDALHAELLVIGVDEKLVHDAGDLAEKHALRGYDAVHLASALALGAADTLMLTWDHDLNRAATDAGLAVAPAV
jgi:predicted nucleic acid-binding protein